MSAIAAVNFIFARAPVRDGRRNLYFLQGQVQGVVVFLPDFPDRAGNVEGVFKVVYGVAETIFDGNGFGRLGHDDKSVAAGRIVGV